MHQNRHINIMLLKQPISNNLQKSSHTYTRPVVIILRSARRAACAGVFCGSSSSLSVLFSPFLDEICVARVAIWFNNTSSNLVSVRVVDFSARTRVLSWATRSRKETNSSLRKANDHPSVPFVISSASSESDLVNFIERESSDGSDSPSVDLIFWIHLRA